MITKASAEWVLLSQVYHHVLAKSPSPESAQMGIVDAWRNGQLRLRAELREHKAQPGLRLAPGEKPPQPPPTVTQDYAIPPNTKFDDPLNWERSRAMRRDHVTKSLFEYVGIVAHRDDVLARWPAAGSELFSLKPGWRGMHIDLKELGRRIRDWWRHSR